jgi:V8-like Glu-specific endopeptidase
MKLESISNPKGEAAPVIAMPAPVTERRTAVPSGKAVAAAKTTRRRLVVGKSPKSLVPSGGGIALETVLGPDERTRIVDTEDAPWQMICSLEIEGPWGDFVGTGWLAGRRTIVTAGHCVFDARQMGGWAKSIVVRPGRDDDDAPFGSFSSKEFSTTDIWRSQQDPDFDIAAIHLREPIGDRVGWFQVASLTDDQLRDYMVNVSGYPADRGVGRQQWWARNRVRALTPRRIFYDVDTFGGQSGAPVFIYEREDAPPLVVGIHAYGVGGTPSTIPLEVNSAPRIIAEVVGVIQGWIDQDNAVG